MSDMQLRQLVTYDSPNGCLLLNTDAMNYFQQTSMSFLQGLVDSNTVQFTDVIVSPGITSKDVTPDGKRRG